MAGTAGNAVNRLVCEECGTVYYSAAAKTLAQQGERCAKCGGVLVFVDGPRTAPPVGTPPAKG
jgi:ribosomal protein S27AE